MEMKQENNTRESLGSAKHEQRFEEMQSMDQQIHRKIGTDMSATDTRECYKMREIVRSHETVAFLSILCMVVISHVTHQFLRRASQPRIVSDIIVGIVFGNLKWVRNLFSSQSLQTLDFVIDFGMVLYMFVLGLEMDPYMMFRKPTVEAKMACAGTILTFAIACSVVSFLDMASYKGLLFTLALSVSISGTASPVLTRLITDQKIGKSDIGRLVIAAGTLSDYICSLLTCIAWIFIRFPKNEKGYIRSFEEILQMLLALLIQLVFVARVSPIFMCWVNNENPEGKPIKGSHLVLSLAFMVVACSCSTLQGYNPMLSAFMTGIFMPNQGRMSKWVTGKINYLLALLYPVFFLWLGLHADIRKFEPANLYTWLRLVGLMAIAIGGKVVGAVLAGVMLGFNWPESVALGMFLATKGHFHVYLTMVAKRVEMISISTSIVIVFVCFMTIVYAPANVARIVRRARKRSPTFRTTLQWLDPSHELRILLCVQGLHNVPTTINLMEISRGSRDPGVVVFVADMIEMTDKVAATMVQEEGVETMTVTDMAVTSLRDQISAPIQAHVVEHNKGITLHRVLALNTYSGMPQDICIIAEELMVALIILPFHKNRKPDGTMDAGNTGFRYVNRKLLKTAPCSVGILVDRGFGMIQDIPTSKVVVNVAVIFMGGKDDREALAYARHIALHKGVKLTVIRFLVDAEAQSLKRGLHRVHSKEREEEMKLDDEKFADFYEKYVASGLVSYTERHLTSSAETYHTLKSFEGVYSLLIVGRGLRKNTLLTVGMNELEQCPELGPIGDVLSGPEFSLTTSILIIQQANLKRELDGLDDDFSVL